MPPTPETTNPSIVEFLCSSSKNEEIITKEFLQKAFQAEAKHKEGSDPFLLEEIVSHTVTLGTKPGDNYMSIIYSVSVELAGGKRRHLVVKCYPNHPSRQQFANTTNMFFNECQVYSKWMPELRRFQTEVVGLDEGESVPLPYADFVYGECIDFQSAEGQNRHWGTLSSLDNYIIMDDLRKTSDFRMPNRLKALDMDHMRLVIEALARVHSLSWAYRYHVESDIRGKFPSFEPNFSEQDVPRFSSTMRSNLENYQNIFKEEFGPGNDYSKAVDKFSKHLDNVVRMYIGLRGAEGMEKRFRVFCPPNSVRFGKEENTDAQPWRIISHGDCWTNNLLFRYDDKTRKPVQVVLLDLQMSHESCVVNDLHYVIHVCTELSLRKCHLDQLLQLYHDTFNNVCTLLKSPTLPGFCMNSLRFRFHRSKLLGYYVASMALPILLKEGKVKNLDEMGDGKNLVDEFADMYSDVGRNKVFRKRLVDVTKGMIEDGVF